MTLREQEKIALRMVFSGEDRLSKAIRERLEQADSTNWENTGVGFYSTIKLDVPLESLPDITMNECNFTHPSFPHGGSYMCSIVNESELELEAVALGGAAWPDRIDPSLFQEMT